MHVLQLRSCREPHPEHPRSTGLTYSAPHAGHGLDRIIPPVSQDAADRSRQGRDVQGLCLPDGDDGPGAQDGCQNSGGAHRVCGQAVWLLQAGRG